ncbi:hypothetical protein J4H27_03760 [Vibrio alginolyticus]|uniref:hypothetical protein n=1 Tax=Vibrio TaxID=662 RepID=UPI0011120ABD|nr:MULTISPECIES: hypothetical protein [Vibrio]HCE2377487.1 hypothetical protein [Vibrio parahaemolyticus]EJI1384879.1 hypothetical protein [Vibrio alginolyticus]MBS9941085.1 hypothetical protein [Vibrio alginolyticus]MCR9486687.1 hypothetical protein [Vibrio alginolyticus]MCR9537645.1 hypothetical protein [Vibrio alginolyticus]
MYSDSKFVFYEKQYYHEIETKQKIDLRLQTIIIFTFAWLNVASYTLQVIDYENNKIIAIIFYNLMAMYAVFIFISLRYSIFYFYGNIYHYLQPPSVFEDYYNEVNEYYTKYENDCKYADKEVKDFIRDNLISATDHNSKLNDERSQKAFESIKWLVIAFIPFFIAFSIFIAFKLDLKHPTKPILIEEKNLSGAYIDVRETTSKKTTGSEEGSETITSIKTERNSLSP